MVEVGRVRSGEGYGEKALKSNIEQKSEIALRCHTECHLATITKHEYRKIFKRLNEKAKDEAIAFYKHTPYFQNWSRAMLLKLLLSFKPRKCKKNEVIIQEDDNLKSSSNTRYVYFIKEGDFELSKKVVFAQEQS
jgi:hypothetical protein